MRHALAIAACTLLLAACGGGGGGGSPAPSEIGMQGVAAKGRFGAGAVVSAHTIDAGGVVSTTVLGTTTTASDGSYKLRFAGDPARPYVVQVTVPPGSGVKHHDEATDTDVALPDNFTLRAAVVPPSTGTITVNVTPFTEMAAHVAENAQGKFTADNVATANYTVGQILGLSNPRNPEQVGVTTAAAAASDDEKRVAILLAAVSVMVNSGTTTTALGCGSQDATSCVVDKLAAATQLTDKDLGTVGDLLAGAIDQVPGTPAGQGVSSGDLDAAKTAVNCTGDDCNAAIPVATDVAAGIAATKDLLTELRSDLTTLFGSPSALSQGLVEQQGDQFHTAMRSVQAPADMLVRDTALLQMGIDLYTDMHAGRSTDLFRSRRFDPFGTGPSSGTSARCRLYADASLATAATGASDANFIGCAVPYYFDTANNIEYIHGFTITPAGNGVFTYTSRGQSRFWPSLTKVNNPPLPVPTAGPAAGTVTAVITSDGQLTSWSATGTLPGAFKSGTIEPASDSNSWNVTATRTFGATPQNQTVTLSGTVVPKDAAGTTLGTLQLKSGGFTLVPNGTGDAVVDAASLDVQWSVPAGSSTPGAEVEGTLSASGGTWDKSHTSFVPTSVSLAGRLTLVTATASTDFLSGTLTASVTGYGDFDATQPKSATNFFTIGGTFTGSATAPSRPRLTISLSTSVRNTDKSPSSGTLQYRVFNSGTTPTMAINVTVTRDSAGVVTAQVAETTHNISVNLARSGTHEILLNGVTKIGVFDADSNILTFVDNTVVSSL